MSSQILVNGQYLVLPGITGSAGDKQGVAKVYVHVNVPDLVTAFTLSPLDVAEALGLQNIICTDRPISQDADGEFTITFQFEGFNQQFTFDQAKDQNLVQLSWKPDEVQDPLETWPHYKELVAEFGPRVDGKFPETYTPKSGTGLPGFSKKSGKNLPNPFLGVDSWIKYGGVFSRSYACTDLPSGLWDKVGILIDYPPDAQLLNIPRFTNRKWLVKSPELDQNGNAHRVTENYRLTGVTNGSEAILYAEAQLRG